jgi:hypothetical protein
MHQLGAQVLIAAILLPVIRDDGMTLGGACREWPKPKPADDRRGSERIGAGTMPSREAYEPERTVPALDPGGGRRCRPAASGNHFHTSEASHGSWDCVREIGTRSTQTGFAG